MRIRLRDFLAVALCLASSVSMAADPKRFTPEDKALLQSYLLYSIYQKQPEKFFDNIFSDRLSHKEEAKKILAESNETQFPDVRWNNRTMVFANGANFRILSLANKTFQVNGREFHWKEGETFRALLERIQNPGTTATNAWYFFIPEAQANKQFLTWGTAAAAAIAGIINVFVDPYFKNREAQELGLLRSELISCNLTVRSLKLYKANKDSDKSFDSLEKIFRSMTHTGPVKKVHYLIERNLSIHDDDLQLLETLVKYAQQQVEEIEARPDCKGSPEKNPCPGLIQASAELEENRANWQRGIALRSISVTPGPGYEENVEKHLSFVESKYESARIKAGESLRNLQQRQLFCKSAIDNLSKNKQENIPQTLCLSELQQLSTAHDGAVAQLQFITQEMEASSADLNKKYGVDSSKFSADELASALKNCYKTLANETERAEQVYNNAFPERKISIVRDDNIYKVKAEGTVKSH